MMDSTNAIGYLKEKHPGSFEGWDEFEISMAMRNRKGEDPVMLVNLHNKGKKGWKTKLHACFIITQGKNGEDIIRAGKKELADEYNSAYVPEFAK